MLLLIILQMRKVLYKISYVSLYFRKVKISIFENVVCVVVFLYCHAEERSIYLPVNQNEM